MKARGHHLYRIASHGATLNDESGTAQLPQQIRGLSGVLAVA